LSRALLLLTCLALAGCYRQQMARQPKYPKPDSPSDFFADGRGARPQVEDTVARGQLRTDDPYFTGRQADGGQYATDIPVDATEKFLERGQERFNIYCSMCHGRLGDGNGKIAQRGYAKVPSYYEPRLREMPVGRIYEVILKGQGAMPDYADQIPVDDRWAIVAYVRALQASVVPVDALTPEQKVKLEGGSRGE
jgi:mono/diheme cytochrome c family protein